ncbi:MAG: Mur ligase domain-containing protein [Patescibacteria group bacterium]
MRWVRVTISLMQRACFIGIGGIGISALARAFLADGWDVYGSDIAASEVTEDLERDGIRVSIGNRIPNIKSGTELVVYSAAVPDSSQDLSAARELGIKTLSYPEALGDLTRHRFTIAVSGSHGKSTTTSFLALMLVHGGLDPTVIVGTKLKEFDGSNFRKGGGKYLVIEADEWNRSFHHYAPQVVVVTNIDKEHLDTYRTYRGVVLGFKKYLAHIPKGGALIYNYADPALRVLAEASARRGVITIPFNKGKFRKRKLLIPGMMNQLNAEAAWQAAKFLGIPKKAADKVFDSYRGSWRRMEKLTTNYSPLKSVELYSDYAHHPTEIKATLSAFREKFPGRRIVCVFQPHQVDRLTRLFGDFVKAFGGADQLVIFPTYRVSGREEGKGKDAFMLAQEIRKRKPDTFYEESVPRLMKLIEPERKTTSVVVFMGAGDLDGKVRKFLSL